MERIIKNKIGVCHYGENKSFIFTPDDISAKELCSSVTTGTAHQLSDGTIEFIPKMRKRKDPKMLRKLGHGRLSLTQDGAYLCTIMIYQDEKIDILTEFRREMYDAAEAIEKHLSES